jgi:hypothetical protein
MSIEEIIDKHYEAMFDELVHHDSAGDGLTELAIEVKIGVDGKTIRRSWQDRNQMLRDDTN